MVHNHGVQAVSDGLGLIATAPGFAGALSVLLLAATLPFVGSAIRYYRSLR